MSPDLREGEQLHLSEIQQLVAEDPKLQDISEEQQNVLIDELAESHAT
jgi:hypothetical protein